MNPVKNFVKVKFEYLLNLFGDESSQDKPASYVKYVKTLDAALVGLPKRVAAPLRSQIISHLDEALESAAGSEQFEVALAEMGAPSQIVEELHQVNDVSSSARPDIFLVVLFAILTFFAFILFLLTTFVVIVSLVCAIRGTQFVISSLLQLMSVIYEVFFVTLFVRKYRKYRQSRRLQNRQYIES